MSVSVKQKVARGIGAIGALGLGLGATLTMAFNLPNDANGHTHSSALVDTTREICGRYIGGAEGSGVTTNPSNYAYTVPSSLGIPGAAAAIDLHWFHDTDGDVVVFDMGSVVSVIDVFPAIDHGPVPGEAIEATVYASDITGTVLAAGDIDMVFDNGWLAFPDISDDYVTRWSLPYPSRYVAIHWGGPKALVADNDAEIDAVCAPQGADLSVTKEPKPGQPRPVPGSLYSYIIRVRNIGTEATPAAPVDVTLRDVVSGGATPVRWTASAGVCSITPPNMVNCSRGRMAPGELWWVEVTVRLPLTPQGSITNTATVDIWDRIPELLEVNNSATHSLIFP